MMLRLVREFGISAARVTRDSFSEAISSHCYVALWQQLFENSPIAREHVYVCMSTHTRTRARTHTHTHTRGC